MFCYDTVLCSIMIRASARPAFMRKASAGSPLRGDRPAGSVCRAPDLTTGINGARRVRLCGLERDPARNRTDPTRALQWSGNPYGNGYGVEMDGNGAQFVKILWIGLDLGRTVDLKRYYR